MLWKYFFMVRGSWVLLPAESLIVDVIDFSLLLSSGFARYVRSGYSVAIGPWIVFFC